MFGLSDFSMDVRQPIRSRLDLERHITRAERAKFIRIGGLFVAGPFDDRASSRRVYHSDLVSRVQEDFALSREVHTAASSPAQNDIIFRHYTAPGIMLNDAGYLNIYSKGSFAFPTFDTDSELVVAVSSKSEDFGRAEVAGREHSMRRLQEILGSTVQVLMGPLQHEPLILPTARAGVVVRELFGENDDTAYNTGYNASRSEIQVFDPYAPNKHRTIDATRNARLTAGSNIRMGIWDDGTFVGSVNARPDEPNKPDKDSNVEIGYWRHSRYPGKGYTTLAVSALANHLKDRFRKVYANVHHDNSSSQRVLERAGFVQSSEDGDLLEFTLAS